MGAPRAFVWDSYITGNNGGSVEPGDTSVRMQVFYYVFNSDSVITAFTDGSATHQVRISLTYADNNIQDLVTHAIQANEGDSSVQVIFGAGTSQAGD